MSKYSGVWTPDKGDGSEDDKPSGPSPRRFYSQQFDDYRRRQEGKARLAAWMNGYEPRETWEFLGGLDCILYVQFPSTHHDVIVFEHLIEWGRLVIWCFGCWDTGCGGCRWAEATYRRELKTKRVLLRGDADDGLPF